MKKIIGIVLILLLIIGVLFILNKDLVVPSVELFDGSVPVGTPPKLINPLTISEIIQLEWASESDEITQISWFEARDFCGKMLKLGGIKSGTSWRLPTVQELMSAHSAKIPDDFRHDFYWSSNTVDYDTSQAWYIYMRNLGGPGSWSKNDRATEWVVRCVR